MPGLDSRTLLVVASLVPLAMTAILLGVRTMRRMPAGFGVWTTSQALLSLGAGLIAVRGQVPDWLSVVGGNGVVLLGILLLDEGYRRFYALRPWMPRWADAVLVVLVVAVSAALLHGSVNGRVVNASLAYAFLLGRSALGPLRSAEGRRSPAQRVVAALGVFGALLLLVRAAHAAAAPAYSDLFAEGWPVIIPGLVLTLVNATSMYVALLLSFERSERQLLAALADVKTLSGLLPICMHCHKIRNDQGYWDQLEQFLAQRTGASFSHGICPSCYAEMYADGGTGELPGR